MGLGRGAEVASPVGKGGWARPVKRLCSGLGAGKRAEGQGSSCEGGGEDAEEPSIKHPTTKGRHKGGGGGGGSRVCKASSFFRGGESRGEDGMRGPERRGEPRPGKPTESRAGGAGLERPGEEKAEPHLILRVLKHVAHTALVLLEAEEDVPQPQGGHEDHEGVKRQVPEVDRVEEHGAAAAAGPGARTEPAEGRPAALAERSPSRARLRRLPARPRAPARPPRTAPARSRPAAPPALESSGESGGGVRSGSANLRDEREKGAGWEEKGGGEERGKEEKGGEGLRGRRERKRKETGDSRGMGGAREPWRPEGEGPVGVGWVNPELERRLMMVS